jgi:TonB family protein
VRSGSTVEAAFGGALMIHAVAVLIAYALIETHPRPPSPPSPPLEIEVETELAPPPPVVVPAIAPPPPAPPTPPPPVPPEPPVIVHRAATRIQTTAAVREPPHELVVPQPIAPSPSAGGAPVIRLDNIAPSATGTAIAVGTPSDRVGRGGAGNGTGRGLGGGSGSGEVAAPISVAAIKTPARPRGNTDFISVGADYPQEAKQLGIEGHIRVRLIVGADGKVRATRLLDSLGHGLDQLAVAKAKLIEFDPAIDTAGHPVASVVVWTFDMTLPKS